MKTTTLTLCMSLFAITSHLYRPNYANAQALCFWSNAQGELKDLTSMCETNPDKKANNQSEIKSTPNNSSSTGNQQEIKSTVQGQQPHKRRRETKVKLDFIPDGSPPIIVRGDEEQRGPDGTVFRGNGMITTPDGINIQMIVQNGKIIGEQYYRIDGTKLMQGESITTKDGVILKQRGF